MVNKRKFIPEGVSDINFKEYEKKECVQANIKNSFRSFGYKQTLTPTFEYYDLFNEVSGTIDTDEMYKLIDASGKILVLRPDVTIPIARMVATSHADFKGYLKFMYMTNVFRSSDYKNGEKREFVQAGVEYLGNESVEADAEVISVAIKALLETGLESIKIDISQSNYFLGILEGIDISEEEKYLLKNFIENKNFAELRNLLENLNIDQNYKELLLEVPYLYGKPAEILDKVKAKKLNTVMQKAVENLQELYEILCDYGYEQYISIDLGLINHINYYTGIIFKGYVNRHGKTILSGGRYDNLSMQFGKKIPATGFGINIDELFEVINKYKLLEDFEIKTDYAIFYDSDDRKKAIELADELRKNGLITEMFLLTEDLNKNLNLRESFFGKNIIKVQSETLEWTDAASREVRTVKSLSEILEK